MLRRERAGPGNVPWGTRGPEQAPGGLDVGSESWSRRSDLRSGCRGSWSWFPPASGVGAPEAGSAAGSPGMRGSVLGGYPRSCAGGAKKARPRARIAGLPRGDEQSRPGARTPDAGGIPGATGGSRPTTVGRSRAGETTRDPAGSLTRARREGRPATIGDARSAPAPRILCQRPALSTLAVTAVRPSPAL
jgi:hypothetical protein